MKALFCFIAFVCVVFAGVTRAQSPNTSTIIVVVVDQSGAVVPGADVVVTNDQTSASRRAVSGPNGAANLTALPITGTYSVQVSLQGFEPTTVNHLDLRAGETVTVRALLKVVR